MAGSLSVDLKEGYAGMRHAVAADALREVLSTREALRVPGPRIQRARRLTALVLAYRAGPKDLWAPVLLDVLAPAILERLRRLRAQPPYLDDQDLRHELVVEVLQVAATMRLPTNPVFVRGALLARANDGVARRLAREARRQRWQLALGDADEHGR
jgi:hypothetical protein